MNERIKNYITEKIEQLKKKPAPVIEEAIGKKVTFKSGSTDCNIPLVFWGDSALYRGQFTRKYTYPRRMGG